MISDVKEKNKLKTPPKEEEDVSSGYENSGPEPEGEVHPCAGETRIRIHYFKDKLTGIESHSAETAQCSKCGLQVCAACTTVSDA